MRISVQPLQISTCQAQAKQGGRETEFDLFRLWFAPCEVRFRTRLVHLVDLGTDENLTNELILILVINMSLISARPGNVASLAASGQATFKHSLGMYTLETASPLATHKMRTFGAGLRVACPGISEEERATVRPEDPAALQPCRTVRMNYIALSDYGRSGEGASKCCGDAEGVNSVSTGLLNISDMKTGIKVSANVSVVFGSVSFSARQH
jgi:hypothetical protein